jgi:hypothetical protein
MKKGTHRQPLFPKSGASWSKRLPTDERRRIVLKNHKGDYLKSAQAMDFLSKGTWDKRTKELSRMDANYFFKEARNG